MVEDEEEVEERYNDDRYEDKFQKSRNGLQREMLTYKVTAGLQCMKKYVFLQITSHPYPYKNVIRIFCPNSH